MQKFEINQLHFEIKCLCLGKYLTYKYLEDYVTTM